MQECLAVYCKPGFCFRDPYTAEDLQAQIPQDSPLMTSRWNKSYICLAALKLLQDINPSGAPQETQPLLNGQQIGLLAGEMMKMQSAYPTDSTYRSIRVLSKRCYEKAFALARSRFPVSPFEKEFSHFLKSLLSIHAQLLSHAPEELPGKLRPTFVIVHSQTGTWTSLKFRHYIFGNGLGAKFNQFLNECEEHNDFAQRLETTPLFSPAEKDQIRSAIDDVVSSKNIFGQLKTYFEQMQKLLSDPTIDPFTKMAHVHQGFVKIHPFGDGNGRTARLLMSLVAHHLGVPPLFFPYQKPYARAVSLAIDSVEPLAQFLRERSEELEKEKAEAESFGMDPEIYSELRPTLDKCKQIEIPQAVWLALMPPQ